LNVRAKVVIEFDSKVVAKYNLDSKIVEVLPFLLNIALTKAR